MVVRTNFDQFDQAAKFINGSFHNGGDRGFRGGDTSLSCDFCESEDEGVRRINYVCTKKVFR